MQKRIRHRRTMKGGFLDTLTNWGTKLSQGASNLIQKAKQATVNMTSANSTTSYVPPATSYTPTASPTVTPAVQQQSVSTTYGGRTRRRRRHMKGGFRDNTPTTGIAEHAAPFSGPTAQPHTMVGGKTRHHKKKGSRSRKHRKH